MGATLKNFKPTGKDEGPPPLNSMECGFIVQKVRFYIEAKPIFFQESIPLI
jgi:hypothetical protein